MNNKNATAFEILKTKFALMPDDLIKINAYVSAGHDLVAAGISTWHFNKGKLSRQTEQLRIVGMCLIQDDSFLYQQLMADLQRIQEDNTDLLDRVLYLYTYDPIKRNTQFHFFTNGHPSLV